MESMTVLIEVENRIVVTRKGSGENIWGSREVGQWLEIYN